MLLALSSLASAAETVQPVINDLGVVIGEVEKNGFQITDFTMGIVADDGRGEEVPVQLTQGDEVIFVGVGDAQRIKDLDLFVYDDRGNLVVQDELNDATPLVRFTVPRTGQYTTRVVISEVQEGYGAGFYTLTTAWYANGYTPISMLGVHNQLSTAVQVLESEGYQILHGEEEVVLAKDYGIVEIVLPESNDCVAVTFGHPDRTKKVDMAVGNPNLDPVGETSVDGNLAINFFPSTGGKYTFLLHAKKMAKRKQTDTAMLVVVGCK